MSPTSVGLSMFGAMLVLMALRVPIAAAMFIPGAAGYWVMTNDHHRLPIERKAEA